MIEERGIRCLATGTGWLYEWASNGMLKKVIRPDGRPVEFRYDALGRRTAKQYFGKVTRWVWDGNVPIHEWGYKVTDRQPNDEENTPSKEPIEDITTWVFEAGTFVPTAKIQNGKQYSIVSDYLGTPIQMYDEQGHKTWDCILDIYGKAINIERSSLNECPFRWAGQYLDYETNLCYNRFRYYSPEMGGYISQDPIGLLGNNPTLYGYVYDTNSWIDELGLYSNILGSGMGHHLMPRSIAKKLNILDLSKNNSIAWYPESSHGTAELHKKLHRNLIDEGVPYHGSKYTGNVDDFFDSAEKAYKGIEIKGYMKIPGTDDVLDRGTPLECIQKLREKYGNEKEKVRTQKHNH